MRLEAFVGPLFEQLYDEAYAAYTQCAVIGRVPKDLKATWPNVLGMLRRILGQKYYREPPKGSPSDVPSAKELAAFRDALRTHAARLRRVVAEWEVP